MSNQLIAPVINTCYKQLLITSLSFSLSLVNSNSFSLVTGGLWKKGVAS